MVILKKSCAADSLNAPLEDLTLGRASCSPGRSAGCQVETAAYIVTSGGCSTLSEVDLPSAVGLMAKGPGKLFALLLNKD